MICYLRFDGAAICLRRRSGVSGGSFDQDRPGVAEADRLKVPRPAPGVNCGTGPARGIAGPVPGGLALPDGGAG
jgi:hypothetical protein